MLKLSLEEEVIKEQDEGESHEVITAREEKEDVKDEEQNSGVINLSINQQKEESKKQQSATFDGRERNSRQTVKKNEAEEVRFIIKYIRSKISMKEGNLNITKEGRSQESNSLSL